MATRPTTIPTWATDPGADNTAPTPGLQSGGWIRGLIPKASDFNWAWHWVGRWLDYLAESVDHEYGMHLPFTWRQAGVTGGSVGAVAGYIPALVATSGEMSFDLAPYLPSYANQAPVVIKSLKMMTRLIDANAQVYVALKRRPKDGSAGDTNAVDVGKVGPILISQQTWALNHTFDPAYVYYLVITLDALAGSSAASNCFIATPVLVVTKPRGA